MARLGALQRQVLAALKARAMSGPDLATQLDRRKAEETWTGHRPRWNVDAGLQACIKRLKAAGFIQLHKGFSLVYVLTQQGADALAKDTAANAAGSEE
jgi:DNA-binding PadR family transcriptional regulator